MIDIVILLTSFGGFALLFAAMPRHQQDWLRRKLPPGQSRACRWGGFALVAIGYVVAGTNLGWGYGALVWLGWLTVAAALVVTLNVNRERLLGKGRR